MKYLVIVLAFISCKDIADLNHTPPIANERLDTVKPAAPGSNAVPLLLENAFLAGTTQKVGSSIFYLYGVNIGKLKVSSGRIVACDPMHMDEYGIPFTRQFPTGEFPVQLSIAKLQGQEVIAFARIKFSDEAVAKWEYALLEGQTPTPVDGKKKYGYSVDAGIGMFIDAEASKALDFKTVSDLDGAVYKEMDKHYHDAWKYAIYDFGKYNLAAFSSGEGDGRYSTYIGFDANGKPCRLVTDFGIFE
jgi:hypothetical protein